MKFSKRSSLIIIFVKQIPIFLFSMIFVLYLHQSYETLTFIHSYIQFSLDITNIELIENLCQFSKYINKSIYYNIFICSSSFPI